MRALGFAKTERQVGGVYFEGDNSDVWRANFELRTAVRVLVRLARFEAGDESAFYEGVHALPWEDHLAPEGTLAVTAHQSESKLYHTAYLAQLAKDAIADRFKKRLGTRPSVDKEDPDLALRVHMVRDRCSLLLDSSGASLHKRGWRRYQGRAPLSETLAAAMLIESGWDRRAPLVDPFAGSGTLLVEAALYAAGRPPGATRAAFAFERWPDHDARAYAAWRAAADVRPPLPAKLRILGSDSDPRHLEGARENLAALGLENAVELACADARAFAPRRGWNGWIVTNPPYGERVGELGEALELHRAFGARLAQEAKGYHLALLGGNPQLLSALNAKLVEPRRLALANGALACTLLLGELA